jgi:hypothetical protein
MYFIIVRPSSGGMPRKVDIGFPSAAKASIVALWQYVNEDVSSAAASVSFSPGYKLGYALLCTDTRLGQANRLLL